MQTTAAETAGGAPDARADRRAQLVRTGIAAFSEGGFDGVSIEAVAKRAGIAQGLLYYYFPSKLHFFRAVVAAISSEMEAATDADPDLPPAEQLRRGLEANVEYARNHALAFRTILRGGGSGDPEVQRIVDERRGRGVQRVLDGLEIADPPPALLLALRGWIGFVEESVLAWLDGQELAAAELVALLMGALRATLREARSVDPRIVLPA